MSGNDCNDSDDTVNPAKIEICDGQDNDCDDFQLQDEVDNDGDGSFECEIDANGWDGDPSLQSGDCDDNEDQTYPGAAENEENFSLCYRDSDGDGYGDSVNNISGNVVGGTDCDDDNAAFYLNAEEFCDGLSTSCSPSLPSNEVDDDGDGYVECTIVEEGWQGNTVPVGGNDCDDTPATTDEFGNITDVGGTETYLGAAENELNLEEVCVSDNDGDGYAPISQDGLDCDDNDAQYKPLEMEADPSLCYLDNDGDGYGDSFSDGQPGDAPEFAVSGSDCDDSDFRHPLANENPSTNCYEDFDEDGYGDSSPNGLTRDALESLTSSEQTVTMMILPITQCRRVLDGLSTSCSPSLPSDEVDDDGDGYVECTIVEEGWQGNTVPVGGNDCDDTPATTDEFGNVTDVGGADTYPGAAENELNLEEVCVSDKDGDGYAPISQGGLDCDDNDAQYKPLAMEADSSLCYLDNDGDGYGESFPQWSS